MKNWMNKPLFSKTLSVALVLSLCSFVLPQETKVDIVNQDSPKYRAMKNTAFQAGEYLSFRVHYGIINAAKITMKIEKDMVEYKGKQSYHIIAEGRTLKAFDWMFKVRDKFESFVDEDALVPLKYKKNVRENNYTDVDYAVYAHHNNLIINTKGKLPTNKDFTFDIASVLLYARNLDYSNAKVGDIYPISIYLDNQIYDLAFKYGGTETIKSDIGKVKCYKLIPKLVVDRVFKGEEDMTVWISADENKIPIRVQADIAVGSLKVDLTSYSGLKNPFTAKQ